MSSAEQLAARRAERQAAGLCTECDSPALPGRRFCQKHAEMYRQQMAKYRAKLERNGLCYCGAPREPGKHRCRACLDLEARKEKQRNEQLRAQGLCIQCGRRKARGSLCGRCKQARKALYGDNRIGAIRRRLRELVSRNRIEMPPHMQRHARYYLGAMVMADADPNSNYWRPNLEACRRHAEANPEWEGFILVTRQTKHQVQHRVYLVTRAQPGQRRDKLNIQFIPTSGPGLLPASRMQHQQRR